VDEGGEGRLRRNRAAVARFASACEAEEAIIAAFLGGSLAAGTADEESDVDLYVVLDESRYDEFRDRRDEFLGRWGDLVFSTVIRDFEGLGFDMVLFVMADGVEGELALATPKNFRATHGGPHQVLVDKASILSGVEFPLLSFDQAPSKQQVERTMWWFWWQVRAAVKSWSRSRWWEAASHLQGIRDSCMVLAGAAGVEHPHESLAATHASMDRTALAEGILAAIHCYLEWAPDAARRVGATYPEGLAQVSSNRATRSLSAAAGVRGT